MPKSPRKDTLVAFNEGEHALAELIGAKSAREIFARQERIAACRRRAGSNPHRHDVRVGGSPPKR